MLQRDDDKQWTVQFDNLWEMSRWIDATPKVWNQKASRDNHGADWTLGHSYDDCLRMAREGWEEGIRSLSVLSASVPNGSRPVLSYSCAGDFPDVPRAVSGDPFNMVRRGKERSPKPTMTIVVNIRASCGVNGREIANYGAALVALTDRLENRGVRVELIGLIATNKCDGSHKRWAISWHIKRPEDPLDLAAVAFSFAHPGMFRRLGFAVMERSPKAMECWGYGMDGGIKPTDFVDLPEGALLIKGVDHNPGACRTMEGALKFATANINEAARALGGEDIAELEEL